MNLEHGDEMLLRRLLNREAERDQAQLRHHYNEQPAEFDVWPLPDTGVDIDAIHLSHRPGDQVSYMTDPKEFGIIMAAAAKLGEAIAAVGVGDDYVDDEDRAARRFKIIAEAVDKAGFVYCVVADYNNDLEDDTVCGHRFVTLLAMRGLGSTQGGPTVALVCASEGEAFQLQWHLERRRREGWHLIGA
jgi:hypothetical protein